MKMRLMILRKVVGHNKERIDTRNLNWDDWNKKLKEEVGELTEALHSRNKIDIMEEVLDVIQVSLGICAKLFKEGIIMENGIHKHNKKLINRGCEPSAVIKFTVNRK